MGAVDVCVFGYIKQFKLTRLIDVAQASVSVAEKTVVFINSYGFMGVTKETKK